MNCKNCKSDRILTTSAKCSDLFSMVYKGKSTHGYVPQNLFFGKEGYGDYTEFTFCLDCGQIQANFPIKETTVNEAFNNSDSE